MSWLKKLDFKTLLILTLFVVSADAKPKVKKVKKQTTKTLVVKKKLFMKLISQLIGTFKMK